MSDWTWTQPEGFTCGGRGRPCFECVEASGSSVQEHDHTEGNG